MASSARKTNGVSEPKRIKALEEAGDLESLLAELRNPEQRTFTAIGQTHAVGPRGYAALALGRLGDSRALEPLTKLLADPYFTMRENAVEALGNLGDPAAVPALIERLDDEDPNVRHFAARALGKLSDPLAVPALIRQLSGGNPRLHVAVADALAAIGDPSATEPLEQALRREPLWHWRTRLRLNTALRSLRQQGQ